MTTYVIIKTRHFYGERDKRTLVRDWNDDSADRVAGFSTPKEARLYLAGVEDETYHLSHNEYGRPDYRICRLDRLPEYLTWQL